MWGRVVFSSNVGVMSVLFSHCAGEQATFRQTVPKLREVQPWQDKDQYHKRLTRWAVGHCYGPSALPPNENFGRKNGNKKEPSPNFSSHDQVSLSSSNNCTRSEPKHYCYVMQQKASRSHHPKQAVNKAVVVMRQNKAWRGLTGNEGRPKYYLREPDDDER